jgi:hypothetical protein
MTNQSSQILEMTAITAGRSYTVSYFDRRARGPRLVCPEFIPAERNAMNLYSRTKLRSRHQEIGNGKSASRQESSTDEMRVYRDLFDARIASTENEDSQCSDGYQ